ncbi:MAG TPA: aminotransferase class III-fold pyridoxal phosphate-dependent enzyme [Gemmatimonadales bacterium]|nr:aminotransferase class III-fold pyridoxal phosphate-dependent enzyme [Gemmatimonadales bacterium]
MTVHRHPNSHVFYRKLGYEYPKIVRGEGCWLIDERGKRYLDAVGGAYVANIGHSNPEIAQSVAEQCRQFGYLSGTMFTHGPVENLADELAETLPGDLSKLYFLCSGSEAVEAALKLARQYWIERGRPGKNRIIALGPGYHGSTLLALSASAREAYKAMFRPWLVDVHRIPASYPYRCECGGQNASCPVCSGNVLEEAITRLGAENVAAFIAEPVGGSSTGGSTPRPEYFRRVREICDRHDVLFIADEVLVGVGRTGTWWAIEPYGVAPDIMTLGKGISGGYAALSAIAAPDRIVDAIAKGSGSFMHAQTFSHHPVACAAGVATMRYLKQNKLVERCAKMGRVLHERLRMLADLPHVGDVRGRGLLAGIEFVEDKASRAPFPRSAKFAERFADAALDAGLTVWPNVGQADGTNGDLVMVAPAFIVTESEIDEIVNRFTQALETTVKSIRSSVVSHR